MGRAKELARGVGGTRRKTAPKSPSRDNQMLILFLSAIFGATAASIPKRIKAVALRAINEVVYYWMELKV